MGFMIELWVAAILGLCFASMLPTFAPHASRQISKKVTRFCFFLFTLSLSFLSVYKFFYLSSLLWYLSLSACMARPRWRYSYLSSSLLGTKEPHNKISPLSPYPITPTILIPCPLLSLNSLQNIHFHLYHYHHVYSNNTPTQ